MADYNVQMKQYNGTSFDNILPIAGKIAGGGGDSEIITADGVVLSKVATGSYVGTGIVSDGFEMQITIPFEPKMVFVFYATEIPMPTSTDYRASPAFYSTAGKSSSVSFYSSYYYGVWVQGITKTPAFKSGSSASQIRYSYGANFFKWTIESVSSYTFSYSSSTSIFNENGKSYRWVVFG